MLTDSISIYEVPKFKGKTLTKSSTRTDLYSNNKLEMVYMDGEKTKGKAFKSRIGM